MNSRQWYLTAVSYFLLQFLNHSTYHLIQFFSLLKMSLLFISLANKNPVILSKLTYIVEHFHIERIKKKLFPLSSSCFDKSIKWISSLLDVPCKTKFLSSFKGELLKWCNSWFLISINNFSLIFCFKSFPVVSFEFKKMCMFLSLGFF